MQIRRIKSLRDNIMIQSTVADACMLAMLRMDEYRTRHNLHFRFMNQVHDAVMLYVPVKEVELTRRMYKETMGNISIPVAKGRILKLDIDIDVMTRWSEKVKKAA